MPAGNLKSHELRSSPSKTEYDTGAVPEIILPVVGAVGKLRQKILGLNGGTAKWRDTVKSIPPPAVVPKAVPARPSDGSVAAEVGNASAS
jgi:hypothetical protein